MNAGTKTLILLLFASSSATAQTIYPTIPGTSVRDWTAPGWTIDNGAAHRTIPGTSVRDWTAPGLLIDNGAIHQTIPGTNVRDWTAPSWGVWP